MKGLTASLAFVLILLLTSSSPGQVPADSLLQYFRFDETPPFNCLFTLFPTLFIENGVELKQFIRSRTFRDIRKQFGDIKAAERVANRFRRHGPPSETRFWLQIATQNGSISAMRTFALWLADTGETNDTRRSQYWLKRYQHVRTRGRR